MDGERRANAGTGIAAMAGLLVGMIIVLGLGGYCLRRSHLRRQRAIELRAPLLE